MSYITPPTEIAQTRRRRLLINGVSGSWKTGQIVRTAPRPMAIFSFPGEQGFDTVPDKHGEITKRVWEEKDGKRVSSLNTYVAVEKECLELIASGKYKSIWFEGLQHMAALDMDIVTDGAFFRGEEFEPQRYGAAYRRTLDFVSRLSNTNVPVIGFTCWAEQKPIRGKKPGEKAEDIPKKWYSALPGQLGMNLIKGRFSVTAFQTLKVKRDKNNVVLKNSRGEPQYEALWQVKESAEVFCAGLKGDPDVTERIPMILPASYIALEDAWAQAEKEASNSTKEAV